MSRTDTVTVDGTNGGDVIVSPAPEPRPRSPAFPRLVSITNAEGANDALTVQGR